MPQKWTNDNYYRQDVAKRYPGIAEHRNPEANLVSKNSPFLSRSSLAHLSVIARSKRWFVAEGITKG